jgi:hypothetical protein
MTNHIDDAIDSVESKRAPRDRFYLCISQIHERITHEFIKADTADEAKAIFKETHGEFPSVCDDGQGNGWRPVKGAGKIEAERMSVTVDAISLCKRTTSSLMAEYRGWNVSGSGLRACEVNGRQYSDDELFKLEFIGRLPGNEERKPKFSPSDVVRKSDLTNIQVIS